MSVELQEQRVRYVGNGTAKNFPFGFTIEEPSQVQVVLADANGTESILELNSHYTVALNADGTGSVTLAQALPTGYALALVSNIEISQERAFYNNTPYYQEQIEGGLDKLTRICQQLKEKSDRHLTVPATSTKTPQQVMTELSDVAGQANEYLQKSEQIYEAAVELKDTIEQSVLQSGDVQVARVEQTGNAEHARVKTEGDTQVARLESFANVGGLEMGVACASYVYTLTSDIPAGTTIQLPGELRYIPKRHHLWLSCDGVVLSPTFFTEIGSEMEVSTQVTFNMTIKAGQELMLWIIPLGRAYEVELTERLTVVERLLGIETAGEV